MSSLLNSRFETSSFLVCRRIGHWWKPVWTPHKTGHRFSQLLHSMAVTGCLLCLLSLVVLGYKSGSETGSWFEVGAICFHSAPLMMRQWDWLLVWGWGWTFSFHSSTPLPLWLPIPNWCSGLHGFVCTRAPRSCCCSPCRSARHHAWSLVALLQPEFP